MLRLWAGGLVAVGLAIAAWRVPRGEDPTVISVDVGAVPADGYSEAVATIRAASVPTLESSLRGVRIGKLRQISGDVWRASVRSAMPGEARLIASSKAGRAEAAVTFQRVDADRQNDGMPDAVELDSEQDQQAFRKWFAFLAEAQFFQRELARPAEIDDCAALIRYAYREALKAHDPGWAKDAKLPLVRAIPSVEKYNYPYTLLGAALFRVKAGSFDAGDKSAFAEFADAQTLQRLNARLVGRDVGRARQGDLLFYRHDAADLPFHGMIYLGESQVEMGGAETYLVYHTGPDGKDPGEIRRPSMGELMRHPNPAWRPIAANPAFLGVYRWRILQ